MKEVILVNEQDEAVGKMEKLEAHQKGLLHRAFSIFVFNTAGELLLQRRALNKYHSGGLWTNTCCSHPLPNEDTLIAAQNRLQEEMGFQTTLRPLFSFLYKTSFHNGLVEHEFDHVYVGEFSGEIIPNREEVMDYQWIAYQNLEQMIKSSPDAFTFWFLEVYERVFKEYNKKS
ncbi:MULTISPECIES: isopentenyl-diphosphate Delta-isomerase [Olivibacter]|jgi:isopentenyl-diphosphate delta-isomerase|uniref:Isopentenyl-diphosphate delta-isomerase n=3 Tax=Sphingobacteriaceae TaxID=84566 RepID=F4C8A1_SPHS2|nr:MULTISPECIES: isopentenyl-diphosphate Delta-isomerase [Olivibacter]MDX3913992.1 isopentenyl-diphosphate Delta-isomerase [Pseudosphingobacterium sp.]QEL02139.1 isopentenyl-diphosphate Delta-isomerase [Olivibacter sp. LS-1]